jgi:hypothetical protein
MAALGGTICLLGGAVLFSALQDTARTGTNSAESAALAASADIQLALATWNGSSYECGTFSDDLASGLVSVTGVSSGYASPTAYVCVENAGSQQVTLSALTEELVDVDFACTGDEATNGDTTCGADGAGELADVLSTVYSVEDCESGSQSLSAASNLEDNTTGAAGLGSIGAGATVCAALTIFYVVGVPEAAVQIAQSDRVTWRYRFTAQA